jgi:Ribonucleotide reductase, barrel domain
MILSEKLISLIQKISSLEKTEEDKVKWLTAYLEMFEKGYFMINRDNLERLFSIGKIESPLTTYGEINLMKHVKRINLDTRQLRKTCEIAVRFLDCCLDVLNFNEDSKLKIQRFRKIGIGISDFDAYCLHTNLEQNKVARQVGEIISNASYRASEKLGEEKGFVPELEESKSYNKGKYFSRYIVISTNSVINGYDLKQALLDKTIQPDDYYIVPRRNSHILLFPNQEIWYPYTDRVEGDYVTEIDMDNENIKKIEPKHTKGELVQIIKEDNPNNSKVYQVINIKNRLGKYVYNLKGEGIQSNQEFEEFDLKGIDLHYLLTKINDKTNIQKNYAIGVIFDHIDANILVDKNTQLPPIFEIETGVLPELTLINKIQAIYDIKSEILDEIGSSMTSDNVYLSFWLDTNNSISEKMEWRSVESLDSVDFMQRVFQKFNRKKKIYHQYENIIKDLESQKNKLLAIKSDDRSILLLKEKTNQKLSFMQRIEILFGRKPKLNEFVRIEENNEKPFNYDEKKYLLSLQQNILTSEFGAIKIILEYSKVGVKSIQIYPEKLPPEDRFMFDIYIELMNLGLQKGVNKKEFIDLLGKYDNYLENSKVIDIIKILQKCLENSPETFEELSNKVY